MSSYAAGSGPGGPSGRLELTWANKSLRLLAHEDGSYEWIDPGHYRFAEVRLLHHHSTVGEVGRTRGRDNLLIRGDALHALASLTELPEFAKQVAGRLRLCYIDPPFNTGEAFPQYDDGLEHSVWLTMMRDRLIQVRDLLARDGSVWVHCDDYEQHRLRSVMDELFGPEKFVATIVWQKRYSRDNRPAIGTVHDFIHVYAPLGGDWKHHRHRVARENSRQYRNPNGDPRGPWRPVPMTAQGYRPNQMYEIVSPAGVAHTPPKGRCWSMVRERFEELLAEGRIYFGQDGRGQPNVIRYLDEDEGLVPWTWWPHDEVGHTDEAKKEILTLFPDVEPFATPKPERLMRRIIHIATDPGDLVLDFFAGSATTAAVAHKMNRRWIAVESSAETVATYALPRLTKVVGGSDSHGVTEACGWAGGGGFRVFDTAPSMYEEVAGLVFLAEWATNGALAEAVAAQLGFAYEPAPPFSGRKGRRRLAVIDGLVDEHVVRLLAGELPEGEQIVVAATGVDPTAREVLRELRRGSSVKKIPGALLAGYQRTTALHELAPVEDSVGTPG